MRHEQVCSQAVAKHNDRHGPQWSSVCQANNDIGQDYVNPLCFVSAPRVRLQLVRNELMMRDGTVIGSDSATHEMQSCKLILAPQAVSLTCKALQILLCTRD
jgi:hypothetical protein